MRACGRTVVCWLMCGCGPDAGLASGVVDCVGVPGGCAGPALSVLGLVIAVLSVAMVRRVAGVLGLAFAVTFLPQAAWAVDPTPTATTTATETTAPPTTEPTTTPTTEPTTTPTTTPTTAPTTTPTSVPVVVEVEPGQFAVGVVALALLVTLAAAGLVLGMRR